MTAAGLLGELTTAPLIALVLVLARVSGLALIAPIFGSRMAPLRVRAALVFFLGLVLAPGAVLGATMVAGEPTPLVLVGAAARELGIGLVIGLGAQLVFAGVQVAGQLAGIQVGLGLANLVDPQTQEQITSLAQWQNLLALLVFLAVDGHHMLIRALAQSFDAVPLGGAVDPTAGVQAVVAMGGGMFTIAVRIAAPVLVTILLVNGAMGMLSKVIPQLNVFIVGFPLNVAAGLLVLAASQPFTIRYLVVTFDDVGARLAGLLQAVG